MDDEIMKNQQFYGIPAYVDDVYPPFVDGKISQMSVAQLKSYVNQVKSMNSEYNLPCFMNDDFIVNMINNVGFEEIEKYMINTAKYNDHKNLDYDENYVLFFRRAIPSEEAKTENFWSESFNEVAMGLRHEIQGEQRFHSVINVTTLKDLRNHGVVTTDRGISDGEISIDPNKNFSKFLFRYKPVSEIFELNRYLENGGISRKELLLRLEKDRIDIMKLQGLPVKNNELEKMLEENVSSDNEFDESIWK